MWLGQRVRLSGNTSPPEYKLLVKKCIFRNNIETFCVRVRIHECLCTCLGTISCMCVWALCACFESHQSLISLFSFPFFWHDRRLTDPRLQPFYLISPFFLRLSCQSKLKGSHLTNFFFSILFTHWCMQIKNNICISQSNPHGCFCCQITVNNNKCLLTSYSIG